MFGEYDDIYKKAVRTAMNDRTGVEIFNDIEDPAMTSEMWTRLSESSNLSTIFCSEKWQKTWWNALGKGDARLVLAFRDDTPIVMAPLYFLEGMGYLVGTSEVSYQLDFIGDTSEAETLVALLNAARKSIPIFKGFEFHWLRDDSTTSTLLHQISAALGLKLSKLWSLPSPVIDFTKLGSENAIKLSQKKSLRYAENSMRRTGEIAIEFFDNPEHILELLPRFFEQHICRWSPVDIQSCFLDPSNQRFYMDLVNNLGPLGQVRLTAVRLDDEFVAFDVGLMYRGRFTMYQGSYEVAHSRLSPGIVSLKYTLLKALADEFSFFDFGPGEHQYKFRFANKVNSISGWRLSR